MWIFGAKPAIWVILLVHGTYVRADEAARKTRSNATCDAGGS
jgi:hypothetical protein